MLAQEESALRGGDGRLPVGVLVALAGQPLRAMTLGPPHTNGGEMSGVQLVALWGLAVPEGQVALTTHDEANHSHIEGSNRGG